MTILVLAVGGERGEKKNQKSKRERKEKKRKERKKVARPTMHIPPFRNVHPVPTGLIGGDVLAGEMKRHKSSFQSATADSTRREDDSHLGRPTGTMDELTGAVLTERVDFLLPPRAASSYSPESDGWYVPTE